MSSSTCSLVKTSAVCLNMSFAISTDEWFSSMLKHFPVMAPGTTMYLQTSVFSS